MLDSFKIVHLLLVFFIMDFQNKVIWITGASSGIGRELALQLSVQNAKLVLTARHPETLSQVCRDAGLNEENCMLLPADLNNTTDAAEWVKKVMAKFGRIDVLINNAGVSQRARAADTTTTTDKQLMEVNFMSSLNITKAVLPTMLQQKSGNIVAISSILGRFGLPLHSTYAAAKHAMLGFFESLHEELKDSGIRVTIICPGFIKTDVAKNALTGTGDKYNVQSPAQENGMPANLCAAKILKATAAGKKIKYIGKVELLMPVIHHYQPRLFYWLMKKMSKGDSAN